MTLVAGIAGTSVLVWAYAVAWIAGVAWWRRRRALRESTRRHRQDPAGVPDPARWLLIRPCAGQEPHLAENLATVARRAHNIELEVVFGVSDAEDRARPAAERACRQLRSRGLAAHVAVIPPTGPNRKASILAGVTRRFLTNHHGIINVDSNVDMTELDLEELLAPLADSHVGAVWAPPVEQTEPGWGARASAAVLSGSLHTFPLLASLDRGSMVGKVFGLRVDAVHRVEVVDLVHYLGEDVELARRLRHAGYEVRQSVQSVRVRTGRRSLAQTIARHRRWMTVVRGQRPLLLATYPILFAPTPLQLSVGALVSVHSLDLALLATTAALLSRSFVNLVARRTSTGSWSPLSVCLDLLAADVVLWAAFVGAISSRSVEWRGRNLKINRTGRLEPATQS